MPPCSPTSSAAPCPPRRSRRPSGSLASGTCALTDEDLQLSLAVCYELHYRGFDGVSEDWEWEPALLAAARRPRAAAPRRAARTSSAPCRRPRSRSTGSWPTLIAADDGPSLSSYMAKQGTLEQWREYLTLRSVYHLQGGRPAHVRHPPPVAGGPRRRWSRSRPTSTAAAARERMHSELFAGLMRDLGLDAAYGAPVERGPGGGLRLGQHDVAVRAAPPLARRRARPPGLRGDDLVRAEPPLLSGPAPARLRRADDGLLRRARRGRRRPRADRLGRHVRLAGRRRARRCWPTSSSARRARWRWTASPPTTCWAPGRPAAPRCDRTAALAA